MCMCIYDYMHTCISACMYRCIYVCMHIRMHTCMYACISYHFISLVPYHFCPPKQVTQIAQSFPKSAISRSASRCRQHKHSSHSSTLRSGPRFVHFLDCFVDCFGDCFGDCNFFDCFGDCFGDCLGTRFDCFFFLDCFVFGFFLPSAAIVRT